MKKQLKLLALLSALIFGSGGIAQFLTNVDAAATPQTGFYVRSNCNQITTPANDQTACLQSTTASGRTAGIIYVWSGGAWVQASTPGGAGINQLTGNVTAGPGNGSQAATIANNAVTTGKILDANVTLGKIANAIANSKLLGSGASGSGGPYAELTLGTNLSMSGNTLNASGGGGGCSTSGSSILSGDGAGGCSNVTVGTGLDFTGGTLSATGGGGALALVEAKIITSGVTDVTFSGLNGNADGIYLLQYAIKNGFAGTTLYSLQPNAVTSNMTYVQQFYNSGGAGYGGGSVAYFSGADSTDAASGYLTLFAKASINSVARDRFFSSHYTSLSGGVLQPVNFDVRWNDTSTNITSLVIHASQTNGIGDGTELRLYKYATPAPAVAGLTLVEHKQFTANATSYAFSTLDGNTDGAYLLSCKVKNNSSSGTFDYYTIQPNAGTSNQNAQQDFATGGTAMNGGVRSDLPVAFAKSGGNFTSFDSIVWARITSNSVTFPIQHSSKGFSLDGTTPYITQMGGSDSTGANMTSMTLAASAANGLGDGSECWLYKFAQ